MVYFILGIICTVMIIRYVWKEFKLYLPRAYAYTKENTPNRNGPTVDNFNGREFGHFLVTRWNQKFWDAWSKQNKKID
jgi:hypothetical protein